ncbi:MAG: hypothetical protein LBU89_14555 [Fibromonadaceae bacterium]|nr:hypothetical protein [Fibromonadaceae bacterium]
MGYGIFQLILLIGIIGGIGVQTTFAQVRGETSALTPLAGELGTHLIAMPTYTYSRMPGTLGLQAEEESWRPDKWRDRQIFNRFVPMIDWKTNQNNIWFYVGKENGDMLWQELNYRGEVPNKVPMIYGGFAASLTNEFYTFAEFNQIDFFSGSNFGSHSEQINTQRFSWFGENLPAYSGLYGGFGYNGTGDFLKNASVLTGSEYLWAWNEKEWMPIRISPRVEGNASVYFMKSEIELHASTEKFQIKDSVAENHNSFGLRLKGKSIGGGLYVNNVKDKENIVAWTDFNHSFFGFANRGFIAFGDSLRFADSLEYGIDLNKSTSLTPGFLFNQSGIKMYAETAYKSKPLYGKVRAYQNYAADFESIGFDSEIAYKSSLAEAGAAYSKEFFEYYREHDFYGIKPVENSAKFFLKYRFLKDLAFTHEWVYRDLWFWNAQVEQHIPRWNATFYAVWLNALSKDRKDFDFGGVNGARFYCGINVRI